MKIRVLVLAVAVVLLAAACGAVASTPTSLPAEATASAEVTPTAAVQADAPTPEPSITATLPITPAGGVEVALAAIERVEGPLATVNGQDITWAEYEPELIQSLYNVTLQYGLDWNQAENLDLLATFQDQILDTVISRTLLRQQSAAEGIEVSADELATAVEEQKQMILDSGMYGSWEEFLEMFGLTEEYLSRLIQDSVLIDKVSEAHAPERQAEQVHARHILVDDAETGQEVLDRLEAGDDWAALAAEYSLDGSNAQSEGDLGWFSRGMMVGPFEEAAFALEPGETSGLVETDYGVHILQVLEKEVRDLEEGAYSALANRAFETWMDDVRASAEITDVVQFSTDTWIPE